MYTIINQQKEIDDLNKTLKSGFHKEEGPFVKALDKALASSMSNARLITLEPLLEIMSTFH